jgi:hypothetical protein
MATSAVGAALAGWRASSLVAALGTRGAVLVAGGTQAVAWAALAMLSSPWQATPVFAVLGGATTLVTVAGGVIATAAGTARATFRRGRMHGSRSGGSPAAEAGVIWRVRVKA